jgi:hypothetical protein
MFMSPAQRSMFSRADSPSRFRQLKKLAILAAAILGLKILASIVLQYRGYFPPDFESPFLIGRESTFTPLYATAFYVHIVSGPLAILLVAFLLFTSGAAKLRPWHRWAGRAQAVLIFVLLVPSALVMAPRAFAGPLAGFGFAALAIATAWCAGVAVWHVRSRRIAQHRKWAVRCFVLLISPLIFRLVAGGLIVTGWESPLAYCANAWLSWLAPLLICEAWAIYAATGQANRAPNVQPPGALAPEAIP